MKNYLTEAIGTFFLVLTVGLSVLSGSAVAPVAIGAVLMVMVYMGGPISGGHFNPAVTLAVLLRGKLRTSEATPYWVAQLLGAFLAAAAVYGITGETFAPAPGRGANVLAALLVEFLYTFALALVVLNVATTRLAAGNQYFGLAIGFTVMAGAVGGGPVSGGAFNPAVGVGPILFQSMAGHGSLAHLWLYLVGPLAGGATAVAVFNIQHGGGAD